MTRINCIPVRELTDAHLGAEYRELPRVFSLARDAFLRGMQPTDSRIPSQYTLGKGHVLFFYPRLMWCVHRHAALVIECQRRSRTVRFPDVPDFVWEMPDHWLLDWVPTPRDMALNRQRIRERLSQKGREVPT